MIVLLHGYRAQNRGDAWLVELAQEVVEAATGATPITFAVDPSNMPGDTRAVLDGSRNRAAAATATSYLPLVSGLSSRLVGLPSPDEVEAAFGVGGAYLRTNDLTHEFVLRSHHVQQLDLMSAIGRSVYLPVSIGPFRPLIRRRVERKLRTVGLVAVRDDVSFAELEHLPNVHRVPDLAVLSVGRNEPGLAARAPGTVAIAVRALKGTDLGVDVGAELTRSGRSVVYGVQSSVGRTNDDTELYERAGGLREARDFGEVLSDNPGPSVVIAGRLHAALAGIAAGIPTIHLGYERKSWGAYRDLGLERWVVNSWTATTEQVLALVEELERDPQQYWDALSNRFEFLQSEWSRLVELSSEVAGGSTSRFERSA